MPTLKQHSDSRRWLIGVPEKTLPPFWLRIFFRPKTIAMHKVPEHDQSSGMYCPLCKNKQPFSDRCTFCGCSFSRFVIVNSETPSGDQLHSGETVATGGGKQGAFHRFNALIRASLVRFSTASLRTRMIVLCVPVLLLTSLAIWTVQHRNYLKDHYSQRYVVALYGINSGMNLTGMVCEGRYKAWKEGVPAEASPAITVDFQTLADLEGVKAYVDETMGEMGAAPEEYEQADRILRQLYAIYAKMNSMIINSPGSLSQRKIELGAAREEYSRGIEDLKENLPAPLVEELKKAGQKYDLRFMAVKN